MLGTDNVTCTRNLNQKQQGHEKPKYGYKTAKISPFPPPNTIKYTNKKKT